MGLRLNILLPIISILTIIGFVFVFSQSYLSQVRTIMEQKFQTSRTINTLSVRISAKREQARINTLMYLITYQDQYLNKVDQSSQEISQLVSEIQPLTTSSTGVELLNRFISHRVPLAIARQNLITSIKSKDPKSIENALKIWEIKADNTNAALMDFVNYNQNSLYFMNAEYADFIKKIYASDIILVLLLTLLIIIYYYYLSHIITSPLLKLSHLAKNISESKYDDIPHINSTNEIGVLANNLETMSLSLQKYHHTLQLNMKKKEQELKRVKDFEAQKDTFLSIASHELKTPITSLHLYISLMHNQTLKSNHPQYELYLTKMENQTQKLKKLVSSLLDITKIKAGRMSFEMKMFDINNTLHNCIEVALRTTKKNTITLEGKALNLVYGDEDKITQVINNFLSNAIRYTPLGGEIKVKLEEFDNYIQVSVQDYGIGIDRKYHHRIFTRFFRVIGPREHTFPGLGIGLFVSSVIIKKHNGKIWVESHKNKGSTFIFTLPRIIK